MLNNNLLTNEKINTSPCVLVNSLFTISENETDIKGYWLDDSGKLYIDNIIIEKYFAIDNCYFLARIKTLFSQGEKCVFYKDFYNYGTLRFPDGTFEILKTRREILYNYFPSETEIKKLLKKYKGLTIYKVDNGIYLLEIYSK